MIFTIRYTYIMQTQDMDDFDIPARRGQSRDKGKGKAHVVESGRNNVSSRPGVIRTDDVSYEEFTSCLRFFTIRCTYIMESQDMDDFVTPPRRGQPKGKAHAAELGRHSVSVARA